jgi:hypothetical protein
LHLTGEFENQVQKLWLDPKMEKELIDMINKAISEDQCMCCESKEVYENFKWHKKWLNTNSCNYFHNSNSFFLFEFAKDFKLTLNDCLDKA